MGDIRAGGKQCLDKAGGNGIVAIDKGDPLSLCHLDTGVAGSGKTGVDLVDNLEAGVGCTYRIANHP